ncbi:MAG TPA: long-chain fatty acid--CoA ligase [Solirubrobacteraceae bacterium]|nr:long-chain fatty acid--CoA ligase [Solirubrobacteraceae bacterium]
MTTYESSTALEGLMMRTPLLVSSMAERAGRLFAEREIVSVTATGVERSTWGEVVRRARRLASALHELGIRPGDRVATFGWNSVRHVELYLAIPSMGAVLHTLNIRLFDDDLRYIVAHGEDRVIFLDASLAERMPSFGGTVEHEVLMPDADCPREGALDYEALVASGDDGFTFPELDENCAAAMCFTSGTTGMPKGVVYSHRSTVLHALFANQADVLGLRERDTVLPIVPMFHANAWGMPYAAALAGSKLVLPGPRMDPADLAELIARERVTFAGAVPTIWQGVAQLDPRPDLSSVERLLCGGSAVPESLIRLYDERFGVPILQAWGMTETSPVASMSRVPPGGPEGDGAYAIRAMQGRVLPFVEFRADEEAGGELQVRGPTIARSYYRDESAAEKFTEDGWLRTGDVAEIEHGAFIKLVDRTKDLVKSGGEWISSVALENEIMAHPDVLEAAVVAVPDERWGERPCACVVRRPGGELGADDLKQFLSTRVAKWWVPERVEFIAEVPKTSVGKFNKKALRAQLADGTLESA